MTRTRRQSNNNRRLAMRSRAVWLPLSIGLLLSLWSFPNSLAFSFGLQGNCCNRRQSVSGRCQEQRKRRFSSLASLKRQQHQEVPSQQQNDQEKSSNGDYHHRQGKQDRQHLSAESTSAFPRRKGTTHSQKKQLRWLLMNMEKLLNHDRKRKSSTTNKLSKTEQELLATVELLVKAKSIQQITKAGQRLQQLDLAYNENWLVTQKVHAQLLERIAKATAMTGLLHISLNITNYLLDNHHHVPSEICQEAICQALRKVGRLRKMESFLLQVGNATSMQQQQSKENTSSSSTKTSQFSYNLFLAALCDPITDKTTDKSFWTPENPAACLQQAVDWLDANKTQQVLGLEPNSVSYGTVMNAASEYGNSTLANHIWDMAVASAVQPSIELYNARLKCLLKDNRDTKMLELWDNEIQLSAIFVVPDKYTIDLMLLPLLRAGRIGEMEALLDQFVATSNSQSLVSDAFQAFLWTLALRGNDVAAARAIFDMYIAPSLSPVLTHDGNGGGTLRLVTPRTRHFTALLEGYRQQLLESPTTVANSSTLTTASAAFNNNANNNSTSPLERKGFFERQPVRVNPNDLRKEARQLYELMLKSSPKIQPDSYTVTAMMGICATSGELTNLLKDSTSSGLVNCSSAVLRAAITAYGDVGDPSSACVLFAHCAHDLSTRYWNVLMGALAKDAGKNNTSSQTLDTSNAEVNRILKDIPTGEEHDRLLERNFCDKLNGLTCWRAADMLVKDYMYQPNAQTYCLLAKTAQNRNPTPETALEIFRNATAAGIPADGRFVNAVLRCFGDDIDAAIQAWKSEIRRACLAHENRSRSKPVSPTRINGKNLLAAYHALIFVAGRALRPDIALRVVYAMVKEGLDADETALNCYKAGKRLRQEDSTSTPTRGQRLRKLLNMEDAYESLLFVECIKYDQRDKRRAGEKRIRIIL